MISLKCVGVASNYKLHQRANGCLDCQRTPLPQVGEIGSNLSQRTVWIQRFNWWILRILHNRSSSFSNSLRELSSHGSVLLLVRYTYSHFYKSTLRHYSLWVHTHTLWPQPGSRVSEPAGPQLHRRLDNSLSPVLSDNIFNSFWLCALAFPAAWNVLFQVTCSYTSL